MSPKRCTLAWYASCWGKLNQRAPSAFGKHDRDGAFSILKMFAEQDDKRNFKAYCSCSDWLYKDPAESSIFFEELQKASLSHVELYDMYSVARKSTKVRYAELLIAREALSREVEAEFEAWTRAKLREGKEEFLTSVEDNLQYFSKAYAQNFGHSSLFAFAEQVDDDDLCAHKELVILSDSGPELRDKVFSRFDELYASAVKPKIAEIVKQLKNCEKDLIGKEFSVKSHDPQLGKIEGNKLMRSLYKVESSGWPSRHGKPSPKGKLLPREVDETGKRVGPTGHIFAFNDQILKDGKTSARELREIEQRKAARRRERMQWKTGKSKEQRKRLVLDARDKRNPLIAEEQGFFSRAVKTVFVGGTVTLGRQVMRVLKKGEKLADASGEILKAIKSGVDQLSKSMKNGLWKVVVAVLFYYIFRRVFHLGAFATNSVKVVLSILLGKQLWNSVADFFRDGEKGNKVAEEQSFFGIDNTSRILATVLALSVFKGKPSKTTVTEFMKRASILERSSDGIKTMAEWIMTGIETCMNYVLKAFGKDAVQLVRKHHKPLKKWAADVDEAGARHDTAQADLSVKELNHLVQLVVQGAEYKTMYRGTELSRMVDTVYGRAVSILQPYVGALNARNNFRVEPVATLLLGKPGIGKTVLCMPFVTTVMRLAGMTEGLSADEIAAQVFQHGQSEYWNGYAGQKVLVIDDVFQPRASESDKDNEYMNIIRMVSSWSYPLNFADLASKGKIFFQSELIFGTTNVESIYSEASKVIAEPQAVARRIKFPYRLLLKPEYADSEGRIDMCKYRAYMDESHKLAGTKGARDVSTFFPFHWWECKLHNFITGESTGESIPLWDVIQRAAAEMRSRAETHADAKQDIKVFLRSPLLSVPESICVKPVAEEQSGKEFCWNACGGEDDKSKYTFQFGTVDEEGEFDFIKTKVEPEAVRSALSFHAPCQWCYKFVIKYIDWWLGIAEGTPQGAFTFVFVHTALLTAIVKGACKAIWFVVKALFNLGKKKKGPWQPPAEWQQTIWEESNCPGPLRHNVRTVSTVATQQADTAVHSRIYSNVYRMYLDLPNDPVVVGNVIAIGSDVFTLPYHYLRNISGLLKLGRTSSGSEVTADSKIWFRNVNQHDYKFSMTVRQFLEAKKSTQEEVDLLFMKFPNVRAHRNIKNNFLKASELKYVENQEVRFDVPTQTHPEPGQGSFQQRVFFVRVKQEKSLTTQGPFSRHVLPLVFEYDALTERGDCGSPLCVFDYSTFQGRTCFGFHVAGDPMKRRAFSTIVTQEVIEKAFEELDSVQDCFEEDLAEQGVHFMSGEELPFKKKGSFLPLGTVEVPAAICPKTSYSINKDMYGTFGPYDHRPAPLKPVYRGDELVYPMDNAVAKYSTDVRTDAPAHLKQAVHVAMSQYTAVSLRDSRREYSFEEAVLGIPQDKFRALPRNTSPGYPECTRTVAKGKHDFFGSEADYDLTTERAVQLKERVHKILDNARQGKRGAVIFMDFLKDELRSSAKVDAVATRLISSAPLDYTIAFRMLFGSFSSSVMRNNIVSGMAPGICCYTQWTDLARYMQRKGPKVFDGDFSAFDASEQPVVHWAILDYINSWYNDGPENQRAREVLWLDLVHSRHIGGRGNDQRYIYQWNKSLPSGHPFTTIVNSMYSLVVLVSAYMDCTGDLTGFWKHVSPQTYGDDNILNVSEEVAERFNQVTVAASLKKLYDLTYTPGRKDGVWSPTTDLTELTFLKRGFRQHDSMWVCPLELESFLYTHYWTKNKRLRNQIINDVLNTALLELSMHEDDVWNKWAPQVYSLLTSRGVVPTCPLDKRVCVNTICTMVDAWY